MIVYPLPIDCTGPHGCPEWAWKQYCAYEEAHPEEYQDRWVSVFERYPTGHRDVLILYRGVIYQAAYQSRVGYWILADGRGWAHKDEVQWWRVSPLMPYEEMYPYDE